jgi:hypothetical protein
VKLDRHIAPVEASLRLVADLVGKLACKTTVTSGNGREKLAVKGIEGGRTIRGKGCDPLPEGVDAGRLPCRRGQVSQGPKLTRAPGDENGSHLVGRQRRPEEIELVELPLEERGPLLTDSQAGVRCRIAFERRRIELQDDLSIHEQLAAGRVLTVDHGGNMVPSAMDAESVSARNSPRRPVVPRNRPS